MQRTKSKIFVVLLALFIAISSFSFVFADEINSDNAIVASDNINIEFLDNGKAKIEHKITLKDGTSHLNEWPVPIYTANPENKVREISASLNGKPLSINPESIKSGILKFDNANKESVENAVYEITYVLSNAIDEADNKTPIFFGSFYNRDNDGEIYKKYWPEKASVSVDYSKLNLEELPYFAGIGFNADVLKNTKDSGVATSLFNVEGSICIAINFSDEIDLSDNHITINNYMIQDMATEAAGRMTVADKEIRSVDDDEYTEEKEIEKKEDEKDQNWTGGIFSSNELKKAFAHAHENESSDNAIYDIQTKVFPKKNGNVLVEQLWTVNNASGTEWYVPMQSLSKDQIINLKVMTEDTEFKNVGFDWDVDANFAAKTNKCGINISNGSPEICFGKSKQGLVTYKVSYELKDIFFVSSDGTPYIYSRFINDNMDPKPIFSSFTLNGSDIEVDDSRIWGFGFNGEIEMWKHGYKVEDVRSEDLGHMTFLIKLDGANTDNLKKSDKTFKEVQEQAFNGSDYDISGGQEKGAGIMNGIKGFFSFISTMIPMIIFFTFIKRFITPEKPKFAPKNINDINIDKDYYFRDIPLKGRLSLIKLFSQMKSGIVEGKDTGFISAHILLWIKNNNIKPAVTTSRGFFGREKEETVLQFIEEPTFHSKLEEFTYNMLTRAAGRDKELSNNELERYVSNNYTGVKAGIAIAMDGAKEESSDLRYISFPGEINKYDFNLTLSGMNELKNLIGFKKYLKEFTIINEREVKEVHLWDDYLIIASMLGIADKVYDEFKELVPDFMFASTSSNNRYGGYDPTFNAVMFANSFRTSVNSGFTSAEQARRSSGRGGSSSFGGGSSGFSGGGSGGGSR